MQTVLDRYKLVHWFNVRKVTPTAVSNATGLSLDIIQKALIADNYEMPAADLQRIAVGLDISMEQLTADRRPVPPVMIHWNNSQVMATCRPISRGGIHFYNYYSLPVPFGHIGPVILDILCPAGRDPEQNAGHREPSLTVNLGPGEIFGKWGAPGATRTSVTWRKLESAPSGFEWVTGSSYIEPSYCEHTYCLADELPARIISYTVPCSWEALVGSLDKWSPSQFDAFHHRLETRKAFGMIVDDQMMRLGYSVAGLAEALDVPEEIVSKFVDDGEVPTVALFKQICTKLHLDYRQLLPAEIVRDAFGKVHLSATESVATVRSFKGYLFASMAGSSEFPDMTGAFIHKTDDSGGVSDFVEGGNAHYYITNGSPMFSYVDRAGETINELLGTGSAVWIDACVPHGFRGPCSMVKMTNGCGVSHMEKFALSSIFNPAATVARARRDRMAWGYDS